ncbi:MAG: heavy-metal-associated domain-containing protein [Alphaproteobacteria bacterium]|nr:heavy-metal-associated domain-containing protein [Alphaproteobacteria bacterium]
MAGLLVTEDHEMAGSSMGAECEIVTTIRLENIGGHERAVEIINGLNALEGVIDVEVASRLGRVTVAYDACAVNLDAIEAALAGLGFPLDESRAARMVRSLNHFIEENAMDSMRLSMSSSYPLVADKDGAAR